MRAGRLVAVLLLLQQWGRVTARDVATELEISERTARRDLEALSLAGIPVHSQQGRGGGWRLVRGARTDLSGLTAAEARALFLVAGPAAGAPAVRSALRKLVQALPEPFRVQAEAAASSMHVDAVAWGRRAESIVPRFLDPLQQAVIDGVQVELDHVARDGQSSTRTIHPLGVVAKGRTGTWWQARSVARACSASTGSPTRPRRVARPNVRPTST